jgi:DNA-binding NtrC family response regulator
MGISPPLLRRFMEHSWPGNVRELKNAVESAAVLAVGQIIEGDSFEPPVPVRSVRADAEEARGAAPQPPGELRIPLPSALADVERRVILAQLHRCGSKRAAAKSLGIGLRTLYTKLREYGLAQS